MTIEFILQKVFALIGLLPFIIGGIALLKLSKKLKNQARQKPKDPNIIPAKIVDIETQDYRNKIGYLEARLYLATVEYEIQNQFKIGTCYIKNQCKPNTIIDIKIMNDGTIHAVSIPEPIIRTEEDKSIKIKGETAARVGGYILLTIPTLMIISQIPHISLLVDYALIPFLLLGSSSCLFKVYKKHKEQQNKNPYEFKEQQVKIIDILIVKRKKDNHTYYTYHPILEYIKDDKVYEIISSQSCSYRLDDIGKTITMYEELNKNILCYSKNQMSNQTNLIAMIGFCLIFIFVVYILNILL